MTNQHVTKEEWQLFFLNRKAGTHDARLTSRILAHIVGCPDCRNFYNSATNLSRVASAYAAAESVQNEESGFAAVASFSPQISQPAAASIFSIEIDAEDGQALFLADTVEASGAARQYAVNPEKDHTCMREDENAFTLTLTGMNLTVCVEPELQGRVKAVLRCYDRENMLAFHGREASAILMNDDIYILELTFDGLH